MHLPFAKYHGLGNDFLVVDARALDIAFRGRLGQKLCDRFRGVGGDGVLVWTGSLEAPEMTVVNADGSVAEMCGNGLRCFVKYLLDRHLRTLPDVTVRTGNGLLRCAVSRGANGDVATVAVQMGVGQHDPARVPLAQPEPMRDQVVHVDGRALHLTALSLGNPHAVTFDLVSADDRARLGPALGAHPLFPQSANIEFAQLLPGDAPRMQVDVFERGCGWTQACGTGATAAAIAAVEAGHFDHDTEIGVRLPGGWLSITVARDGMATMRGPATHVYDGVVDVGALLGAD